MVFQELFGWYVPPDFSGAPENNFASRHVTCDYGACGNETVLSEHDTWQHRYIGSDSCSLMHRDALVVLEAVLGAAQEIVVGKRHLWSDEAVIADLREGGYVGFGFNFATRTDAYLVFYRHATANNRQRTDFNILTDRSHVGDHYLIPDGAPTIDDGKRTDNAIVLDQARAELLLLGDRAIGGLHRKFANDAVIVDSDIVANQRVRMDNDSTSYLAVDSNADVLVNDYVMPQLRTSADGCRWMDEAWAG